MNKELLPVGESADVLAVSRWTISRWVDDGRLERTKIGCGIFRERLGLIGQARAEQHDAGS